MGPITKLRNPADIREDNARCIKFGKRRPAARLNALAMASVPHQEPQQLATEGRAAGYSNVTDRGRTK